MRRAIIAGLLIATVAGATVAQGPRPVLTGTWERVALGGAGNPGSESMTIVHNEPYIYLLYRIKDDAGIRTLDLKGMRENNGTQGNGGKS